MEISRRLSVNETMHCLSYHKSEKLIAIGWSTGLVEIRRVDERDGSAAERLTSSFLHKKPVKFLSFIKDDRFVSVDEDGHIGICGIQDGQPMHRAKVGGEYVEAALSDDQKTLFLFSYRGIEDTNTFALDIESGRLTFGPDVDDLSVRSQVFAVDSHRAAYRFLHEEKLAGEAEKAWGDDERIRDALAVVNFQTGEIETILFEDGPESTFGDLAPMYIAPDFSVGVRPAIGSPPPIVVGPDGAESVALQVELFDPQSGKVIRRISVFGTGLENKADKKILSNPSFRPAEFREKMDSLLKNISSLQITDDAKQVWVGGRGGVVRAVMLDDDRRTTLIRHGLAGERQGFTLNDVFDTNVHNNQTLAVSATGRFVAFGVPNDFFAPGSLDLYSETPIELQPRIADSQSGVRPNFVALQSDGNHIAMNVRGETALIFPLDEQEPLLSLDVPYGDELLDASISAKGKEIILSYGGRNSLRIRETQDGEDSEGGFTIEELPLPPHTMFGQHIDDDLVVFVNSHGTVVTLHDDTFAAIRNEDEGTDEDDDDEEYEDSEDDSDYEDDSDDDEYDEDEDEEDSEELNEPRTEWKVRQIEGFAPLSIEGNYEGDFIYSEHFEQRYDLYTAAVGSIENEHIISTLSEDGRLDVYRFDRETIAPLYMHRVAGWPKRMSGGGSHIAVFNSEGGSVEVFRLERSGAQRLLSFQEDGLRIAELKDDGSALILFNELTGVVSVLDIATGKEQATLRYNGPAIHSGHYHRKSGRLLLVESDGTMLIVDPFAGALIDTRRLEKIDEDWSLRKESQTLGSIQSTNEKVTRSFAAEEAQAKKDEEAARRREMFGHTVTLKADEKPVRKQIEKAIEKIKKMKKSDHANRAALFDELLAPFADLSYESVSFNDSTKVDIGRCFTIRGCERRDLDDLPGALADFEQGRRFRYPLAVDEILETYAFHEKNAEKTLALADRLSLDFEAKKGIGIRKATGVYCSILQAYLLQNDEAGARRTVRFIVDDLLPYLEEKDDKHPLQRVMDTLKKAKIPFASELLTSVKEASKPKSPERDEENFTRLKNALSRAQFLVKNDRWHDAGAFLSDVLAPYQDLRYADRALSSAETGRISDLLGLQAEILFRSADYEKALVYAERAIEFREAKYYGMAMESCIRLGRYDRVIELFEHMRLCPFNWSSEYFSPLAESDYAHAIAMHAIAAEKTGRPDFLPLLTELYGEQSEAIKGRMANDLSVTL